MTKTWLLVLGVIYALMVSVGWDVARPWLSLLAASITLFFLTFRQRVLRIPPGFRRAGAAFAMVMGFLCPLALLNGLPVWPGLFGITFVNSAIQLRDRFGVGRPRLLQLALVMIGVTIMFEPWRFPSVFYGLAPVYVVLIVVSLIHGGSWLEFADAPHDESGVGEGSGQESHGGV